MKLGLLSDELKELFLSFSVDLLDVNILEYLLETPFVDCITDERGLRIRDLPAYINNLSRGIRLTKHLTEQSDAFSPTVRVFEFDIDKELGLWEKEKVNLTCMLVYDLIFTFIGISLKFHNTARNSTVLDKTEKYAISLKKILFD